MAAVMPNEKDVLMFVAQFAGWTRLKWDDLMDCYFGRPPKSIRSDQQVPDYVYDLNAWQKDVWPELDKKHLCRQWHSQLESLCGRWIINQIHSSAQDRCLALWHVLGGVLPKETDHAEGTGSDSPGSESAAAGPTG